jgi:hypothetical protein
MITYSCDCCSKQVLTDENKWFVKKLERKMSADLKSMTAVQEELLFCSECTGKIEKFLETLKKENGKQK